MEWLSNAGEWKRVATDSAAAAAGVSGNIVSLSKGRQFADVASHIDFLDKLEDVQIIASRHARGHHVRRRRASACVLLDQPSDQGRGMIASSGKDTDVRTVGSHR